MKNIILIMIICLSGIVGLFGTTGQEVLDKVEATLTSPKDMEAYFEMSLGSTDNDRNREQRTLRIWNMGKNKRVVKFLTPSSINNVGVLALNDDEMYVYLPAYQKVRRIQGDMKNNDFQGTDFSYREMGSYNYSSDYDSSIVKEGNDTVVLNLKKKAGSDAMYDKLIMIVDKSNYMFKSIEMYTGDNKTKVLTVLLSEKNNGYWTFTKIRMENLGIKHYTEINMKDIKFDQNLDKKEIFTQRFLTRHAD